MGLEIIGEVASLPSVPLTETRMFAVEPSRVSSVSEKTALHWELIKS